MAPVQQVGRHEGHSDETRRPSQAGSKRIVSREVDVNGETADRCENEDDEKGEAKEYDFPRVLRMLKKNHYKGPISVEFGRVFEEQNLGIPLELALRGMAERIPVMDVRFFVIAVAASEAAVGLAIIIAVFRTRGTLNVDEVTALKN